MASVNRITLMGHAGRDPETRSTPSGQPVCTLSLATSERRKSQFGQAAEQTEWHRVVLYAKLAEVASQWVKKGDLLFVEGRVRSRKWTDAHGGERNVTEVIADRLELFGARVPRDPDDGDGAPPPQPAPKPAHRPAPGAAQAFDDDIPY